MARAPADSMEADSDRSQLAASLWATSRSGRCRSAEPRTGRHRKVMQAPSPGAESTVARPPTSCMRAMIEPDTPCLPRPAAAGSKPRPLSFTSTVIPQASLVSVTVRVTTASSPAWRSELRTASSVASAIACATSGGISCSPERTTSVRISPAMTPTPPATSFNSVLAVTGLATAIPALSESSAWRALPRRAARSGRPLATAIKAERM